MSEREAKQRETKPRATRRKTAGQGATRAKSKSSPEAVERLERDLQCVQLRRANVDWQTIADRLGYASPGHAHDRFMLMMREYPREDVETTRNLIRDRYEVMLRALWPDVLQGKWLAVDRASRILEAIAKLEGANRPEKIEITPGETDLDAALRELEEQLRRRAAGRPVPQE